MHGDLSLANVVLKGASLTVHLPYQMRKGNGNVGGNHNSRKTWNKAPGTAGVNGSHPRGATMLKGEGRNREKENRGRKKGGRTEIAMIMVAFRHVKQLSARHSHTPSLAQRGSR